MNFINELLANFIQTFKTKNPFIFGAIVTALVLVYVGLELMVNIGGIEKTDLIIQIIKYVDVAFLTIMGSKTAPFLKEYFSNIGVTIQSTDSWWTSLIDGFKMKSPVAFAAIAVVVLGSYVVIQYSLSFSLIPEGNLALFAQIISYLEVAGLILLGSRTGQYIIDHPPKKGTIGAQSADAVLYYD